MPSLPTATITAKVDFIVIGGGIAGASVAFWLAQHGRVVVLEREDQPGYHSTGRSAAVFMESYGSEQVRALTRASRAFLENPPAAFGEHALLTPRGSMMVAAKGQESILDAHWQILTTISSNARLLDAEQARALFPALSAETTLGAAYEPDTADMDVHAIHQGYLRGMRGAGGELVCRAQVTAMDHDNGIWRVTCGAGTYEAPVVLNAAGAWVDTIARLAGVQPIGIEPRRRSAFIFEPPSGLECARWPMAYGADGDWYIKPDAGMMLGSPANADLVEPHDVQPEEMDIALAIDRIESNTSLTIRRPTRTWAGLRSFALDDSLVGGFDDQAPGFFWVAGQGGYGIQTSAAMGETCAQLARGLPVPASVAAFGLTAEMLSPHRLRHASADPTAT